MPSIGAVDLHAEKGASMLKSFVSAALMGCWSTAAMADKCQVTFPAERSSLSPLIAKAKMAAVTKDEFETTAAFQERQRKAAVGLPSGLIAIVWPGIAANAYDADTQTVTVNRYTIESTCFVTETSLGEAIKEVTFKKPARMIGSLRMGSNYCAAKEVSRIAEKSYVASNSYGASVTVRVSRTRDEGLYFGYGDTGQSIVPGDYTEPAFRFGATPEEARSLKTNAQILWLVRPRAPFFAKGTYYLEPKIDSPTELYGTSEFLVVEPVCAAVVDRTSGKMLDSFAIPPSTSG